MNADSEIPQGMPRCRPYSIWRATAVAARLGERACRAGSRSSSRGIRYSNIVPPQEIRPIRPAGADEGPAELEPVPPRGVAPRDGQEAGQARLRGQQVVAGAVEPPLAEVVADREEVPVRLVEEAEVHGGARVAPARSMQLA